MSEFRSQFGRYDDPPEPEAEPERYRIQRLDCPLCRQVKDESGYNLTSLGNVCFECGDRLEAVRAEEKDAIQAASAAPAIAAAKQLIAGEIDAPTFERAMSEAGVEPEIPSAMRDHAVQILGVAPDADDQAIEDTVVKALADGELSLMDIKMLIENMDVPTPLGVGCTIKASHRTPDTKAKDFSCHGCGARTGEYSFLSEDYVYCRDCAPADSIRITYRKPTNG